MYYLLETNYIISENEIKEQGFEIVDNTIGKWEKLDGKFGIKNWFNAYGFIKKQSDNVLDLIEVGDLIKDDDCVYEVSDITYKGYSDNRRSFVSQPASFYHHEWEITSIYKPNTNGDYIKVWEKESE